MASVVRTRIFRTAYASRPSPWNPAGPAATITHWTNGSTWTRVQAYEVSTSPWESWRPLPAFNEMCRELALAHVFARNSSPTAPPALILSNAKILIDYCDTAFGAIHPDGDLLQCKLRRTEQILHSLDFFRRKASSLFPTHCVIMLEAGRQGNNSSRVQGHYAP